MCYGHLLLLRSSQCYPSRILDTLLISDSNYQRIWRIDKEWGGYSPSKFYACLSVGGL